jgi:hypothetical protein
MLFVMRYHAMLHALVMTNKGNGMVRKRRPGGGRKPQGTIRGKASSFSTRITPAIRDALKREAALSGQSISQVAERLLILGLAEKRRRASNKPLRAICFLIEQIALSLGVGRWIDRRTAAQPAAVDQMLDEWRTDPFRNRAFKIAVGSLLSALEPKGEIRSPFPEGMIQGMSDDGVAEDKTSLNPAIFELMKHTYKSPENLAAYAVSNIWAQLNRSAPLSERESEIMRRGEWVGEMMLAEFYEMQDARRDLGLDF